MGLCVNEAILCHVLDERPYTLDELVEIAHERYGRDKGHARGDFQAIILILESTSNSICRLGDKYYKICEFNSWQKFMLGKLDKMPEGYFEARPKLINLYLELEKKYGSTYSNEYLEKIRKKYSNSS